MEHNLWVEHDRYHTAIVFLSKDVRQLMPELTPVLNDSPFVRFGWGDSVYYGASNQNVWKALKALFLPTGSVVEVSNFPTLAAVGKYVFPLDASSVDKVKLLSFISLTFKRGDSNEYLLMRVEHNGFHYYCAHGIYTLFKNCNNWTAKSLRRGGMDIHYPFAFFSRSVMKQLYKLSGHPASLDGPPL